MNIDRVVRAIAGAMVLTALVLSRTVAPGFFWVAVFVGANLLQSAFTRFCPLANLLGALGVRTGGKASFRLRPRPDRARSAPVAPGRTAAQAETAPC